MPQSKTLRLATLCSQTEYCEVGGKTCERVRWTNYWFFYWGSPRNRVFCGERINERSDRLNTLTACLAQERSLFRRGYRKLATAPYIIQPPHKRSFIRTTSCFNRMGVELFSSEVDNMQRFALIYKWFSSIIYIQRGDT